MSGDELADAVRYGPFDRALRCAIERRGLSLSRLRAHLDQQGVQLAESTLSYWQRGLRQPDGPRALATVRGLERVLDLPKDSLVVLIGPRGRDGNGKVTTFEELTSEGGSANELLIELGGPDSAAQCNADLRPLLATDRVVVGPDGEQREVRTRLVLQATRGGVDRYYTVYHGDPGSEITGATLSASDGGRVGRVRRKGIVLVGEVLFDRKLTEGEVIVISCRFDDPTGGPCPGYFRLFRTSAGPYLLQLEFAKGLLPARCVREVRPSEGDPPTESAELVIDRSGVVSTYFGGNVPGIAGIGLEWA